MAGEYSAWDEIVSHAPAISLHADLRDEIQSHLDSLIERADMALYTAKVRGRNQSFRWGGVSEELDTAPSG